MNTKDVQLLRVQRLACARADHAYSEWNYFNRHLDTILLDGGHIPPYLERVTPQWRTRFMVWAGIESRCYRLSGVES